MSRRVYFIKPVGLAGPIKIGCSYSPEKRRSALDCWSPFALEIIAQIDGGANLERQNAAWVDRTRETLVAELDALAA